MLPTSVFWCAPNCAPPGISVRRTGNSRNAAPHPVPVACPNLKNPDPKKCQEQVAHDYMLPVKTIFAARPLCNPPGGPVGHPGWCTAYSVDMLDPSSGIGYLARVKSAFWLPRLANNPLRHF